MRAAASRLPPLWPILVASAAGLTTRNLVDLYPASVTAESCYAPGYPSVSDLDLQLHPAGGCIATLSFDISEFAPCYTFRATANFSHYTDPDPDADADVAVAVATSPRRRRVFGAHRRPRRRCAARPAVRPDHPITSPSRRLSSPACL